MRLSDRVQDLLGSMSLEEKTGQLFVFTWVSLPQVLHDMRLHPGGFVRIYSDAVTVAREHEILQADARIPLILGADFERGIGSTISGAVDIATNMGIGATGSEEIARACGNAIATEARAIGVNMNYVPVVDVNTNPLNPVIGVRSFGGDARAVARLGAAFIRGSREGGVLTSAKHFPGHGDTAADTHSDLAVLQADRARLDSVELLPFRHAIEAGVDSIMTAHLRVPAVEPDPLPATLSPRVIRDLLRGELGFDGVVVSDALEMGAITRNFPPREAYVRAINAGVDNLIMPLDNENAVRLVVDAVRSGEISGERLDEAAGRILTMKENRGLFDEPRYSVPDDLLTRINTPAHRQLALRANLQGITLVRDDAGILPLKPGTRVAALSFSNHEEYRSYFAEPRSFGAHIARAGFPCEWAHCGTLADATLHEHGVLDRALRAAERADVIVLGAFVRIVLASGTIRLEPRFVEFARKLANLGKPVVAVAFGNPYALGQLPMAGALVAAYGFGEATQEAAAQLICGSSPFRGKLPVTLPPEL